MGNLVYLEGFAGSEEDPGGADRRPMPFPPHRNPYAVGTKPWAWWDAGYRGEWLPLGRGTFAANVWQAGRDAALLDSPPAVNSEEDPSGAARRPMPLLPKYRNLLPTENRLRPLNSKITYFVDRPHDVPSLRGLPGVAKSPRDARERKNRGTSELGVANPYWQQGTDDGHGPTMGPGGQQYATAAPYQRTRRDGYVYSREYWETLHKMDLLFQKNQGWAPNTGHDDPASLAELDQFNAWNAEMNAKTAAAVKANDPMLYALQQANAKYAQTNAPADLEAYNAAYSAWWADKAAWEAAHPDLEAPAKTGSSTVPSSTRPVLPGGGLVLVVSKGSGTPLEDWQKDEGYLRSLGYYDTPMPMWDDATQTWTTPSPRQGSAADYAIWKASNPDVYSQAAPVAADIVPPGPKQQAQIETPTPIQALPSSTGPTYPLPAPPAGAQDFAPLDQSHNYTNATPIPVSYASPDPFRVRNAPMAYAVPDQGLRYRGGPAAPAASPVLPAATGNESWLQSSSIIPSVKNLYLVGGAAALLGFLFLMPKSAAAK